MSTTDAIFKALLEISKGKKKPSNPTLNPTQATATAKKAVKQKDYMDNLTGLHNRDWFEEELGRKMVDANRLGTELWLFILDFDFFKTLNVNSGQNIGDQVLKIFGEAMINEENPVSRIGGEEFAQIVSSTLELEDLQKIVSRLSYNFKSKTKSVLNQEISISFGTAKMNFGETPSNYVNRVEAALFRSKKEGRDKAMLLEGHPRTGDYITIPFIPADNPTSNNT